MKGRYRVSLNSVHMDTLNDNLLILDVAYSTVGKQVRESQNANLDGYDVVNTIYDRQTVTISFELHIYDVAKRNAACQAVNAWAMAGGTLRVNDRTGQHLTVVCQETASIESARNWTDPLTLVFVTTGQPFWESDTEKTLTMTGAKPSGSITLDGNVGNALVSLTATAKAAISSIQVTVGSTTLKFTGISVPNGKTFVISYTKGRYLKVTANGSSVLAKLDPSSSDNLLAPSGKKTTITASASGSMTFVFTARGLWI